MISFECLILQTEHALWSGMYIFIKLTNEPAADILIIIILLAELMVWVLTRRKPLAYVAFLEGRTMSS